MDALDPDFVEEAQAYLEARASVEHDQAEAQRMTREQSSREAALRERYRGEG